MSDVTRQGVDVISEFSLAVFTFIVNYHFKMLFGYFYSAYCVLSFCLLVCNFECRVCVLVAVCPSVPGRCIEVQVADEQMSRGGGESWI